jgi:hypothetical protein
MTIKIVLGGYGMGTGFHMIRLCHSYGVLLSELIYESLLHYAVETSNSINDVLLTEAAAFLNGRDVRASYIVMLAPWWRRTKDPSYVMVRGHACRSGEHISEYSPGSVSVVLALSRLDNRIVMSIIQKQNCHPGVVADVLSKPHSKATLTRYC